MKKFLMAGMAVWVLAGQCWAGSLQDSIDHFRKIVLENYQSDQAYEDLVSALEADHQLDQGLEKFKAIQPSILTLEENDQAFHRFGIALYSKGHEEEAYYVLDIYAKSRKYSPEEGLAAAQAVAQKAVDSGKLPAETSAKIKEHLAKPSPIKKSTFEAKDRVYLKSGQVISGTVLRKEEDGIMLKMGEGEEVFWSNDEIEKVEKAS